MLGSLQQFGKEIGKEIARAWEALSEGWRELLTRSGGALTRFVKREEPSTPTQDGAETPSWGLLAGDVADTGSHLVVRLELPGVEKEDCEVVVEGSLLTIRGEKRYDREYVGAAYYARQCAYGSFERVVALPCSVDSGRAEASLRNGVLTVRLPKLPDGGPRRIAL
jgi:HSP20 family protein